jgi:hypothetical protein
MNLFLIQVEKIIILKNLLLSKQVAINIICFYRKKVQCLHYTLRIEYLTLSLNNLHFVFLILKIKGFG